jgi:hypothetical protein
MKVLVLVILAAVFMASHEKDSHKGCGCCSGGGKPPEPPPVPDFDKPENYLWSLFFGTAKGPQSHLLKITAAILVVGGHFAVEFIKAMK